MKPIKIKIKKVAGGWIIIVGILVVAAFLSVFITAKMQPMYVNIPYAE